MDLRDIFSGRVSDAKWRALGEYLAASDIVGGPGVLVRRVGNRTIIRTRRRYGGSGTGEGLSGAFFTTYVNGDGHRYLQGGTVTGGHGGSEAIVDYKLTDAVSGPVAADGNILYLKATCVATVADGVLLPGLELTSASLAFGTSVPDNHTFTVTADSGDLHFEVGRWTAAGFLPAGPPGNFAVGGCIGNYALSKA